MISINGKLRLEEVGPDQIKEIIALAREIWIPSFRSYFNEEQLWALFEGMYNRNLLQENLKKPNYHYYFIKNPKEEPIGYLALEFCKDSLKIDKIYVHPKLQGSGIGSLILVYILKKYKENRIWLRVNRGNIGAVKLYEKHGFTTVARKDFHGPGQYKYEDYIMEKAQI